jgi:hypothetical protein
VLELVRYALRPRDGEAALIMRAVDQICVLYGGLPAYCRRRAFRGRQHGGALLVTRYPERVQGSDDAFGRGTRHCALHDVRDQRDAWPTRGEFMATLMVIRGSVDFGDLGHNGHGAARAWADAAGARSATARIVGLRP